MAIPLQDQVPFNVGKHMLLWVEQTFEVTTVNETNKVHHLPDLHKTCPHVWEQTIDDVEQREFTADL